MILMPELLEIIKKLSKILDRLTLSILSNSPFQKNLRQKLKIMFSYLQTTMKLLRALQSSIYLKKSAAFNKSCISITSFFNKYKKGSKHFRRVIEKYKTFERDPISSGLISCLHVIDNVTFEPDIKRDTLYSLTFSVNFIENSFRTTFFQFQNNYWKLNNQISKLIPEISPDCLYCRKKGVINPEKETISHFFNNCQTINEILKLFWEIIPNNNFFDLQSVRGEVLLGFNTVSTNFNKLGNIIILLTLAFIKFQRHKKNIDLSRVYTNFVLQKVCTLFTVSSSFRGIVKLSKKFKAVRANCSYFLHQNEY